MSKTDKELAVEIAKSFIEAHSVKLAVASNNVKHQTVGITLDSVNKIIESVHSTLQKLPDEK
ncbi:MAG: hypothetical protein ACLUQ0_05515 [Enterococcus italicus]|uniref:hypothetical protein n=1 Tax=Enterococcus italicus TaxID=246144 RepID=UPI0039950ACF